MRTLGEAILESATALQAAEDARRKREEEERKKREEEKRKKREEEEARKAAGGRGGRGRRKKPRRGRRASRRPKGRAPSRPPGRGKAAGREGEARSPRRGPQPEAARRAEARRGRASPEAPKPRAREPPLPTKESQVSAIKAADVKALRERTGAAMMDCKARADRGRRRHRQGDRDPPRQGPGVRRQARGPLDRRGRRLLLHPRQRQDRRARRDPVRDGLRRPQRRLQRVRPRDRAAHRRGRAAATSRPTRSPRTRSPPSAPSSSRRPPRRASPRTSASGSSRASWPSGARRSRCSTRRTSTATSTTARRSSSSARRPRRAPGENIRIARFARFVVGEDGVEALRWRPASARLRPGPAEALRRGPDGRRSSTAPIPSGSSGSPRQIADVHETGLEIAIVVGAGNIYRGLQGGRGGHGPGDRRLHGDAGDGAQRADAPGRAREARAPRPG